MHEEHEKTIHDYQINVVERGRATTSRHRVYIDAGRYAQATASNIKPRHASKMHG
jgi:hypothetical protein